MPNTHEITLCIGSNLEPRRAASKIEEATALLEAAGVAIRANSHVYPSASGYQNCVMQARADAGYDTLLKATKDIERRLGRTPEMKDRGEVPIDIDIVVFDGEVKRQADYDSAYFKKGLNYIGLSPIFHS